MNVVTRDEYDKGTGKYQTASESGEDRTVTAPTNESTEKYAAASESGERTTTASTDVGPREDAKAVTRSENKAMRSGDADNKSLDDMTKDELLAEADRQGVEVASSWTKAEIRDALNG